MKEGNRLQGINANVVKVLTCVSVRGLQEGVGSDHHAFSTSSPTAPSVRRHQRDIFAKFVVLWVSNHIC